MNSPLMIHDPLPLSGKVSYPVYPCVVILRNFSDSIDALPDDEFFFQYEIHLSLGQSAIVDLSNSFDSLFSDAVAFAERLNITLINHVDLPHPDYRYFSVQYVGAAK